jgi:hypothetical protein
MNCKNFLTVIMLFFSTILPAKLATANGHLCCYSQEIKGKHPGKHHWALGYFNSKPFVEQAARNRCKGSGAQQCSKVYCFPYEGLFNPADYFNK